MVEPTLHVKNICLRKVHNFGFVCIIDRDSSRPDPGPFSAIGNLVLLLNFAPMYHQGCQWGPMESLLRMWLMIIQICEYLERHLNFRRHNFELLLHPAQLVTFSIFCCFFPFNMARQRSSISKHRLFPNHSSATSPTSPGPATSREEGNTPARSEQHSDRNSVAARVSGRREDNSSVGTRSRGVQSPGLNSSNATPQSARSLIPTRTATSTPARASREHILAPLDLSPVDHEAANLNESIVGGNGSISAAVMEQLKQFFATQGEFNKNLELRLDELKGRENRTKQVTRPTKDLSVSGYNVSNKIHAVGPLLVTEKPSQSSLH